LIYRALALHFTRQGQFKLCEDFMNEAEIPVDDELRDTVEKLKNEFEQMYTVLYQLEKQNNLSPAIRYVYKVLNKDVQLTSFNSWAQNHSEGLKKLGSSLEFNLHRLKFIQLLLNTDAMAAVMYGRSHFTQFGEKHFSGKYMQIDAYINN
jgi:hypothetical protein